MTRESLFLDKEIMEKRSTSLCEVLFDVFKSSLEMTLKSTSHTTVGSGFGELALLHDEPRAASVERDAL